MTARQVIRRMVRRSARSVVCRPLRLRDDDGSILLLAVFYGFLSLVLILMVVAATSLYLERKRLFTVADAAALAGAEAFDLAEVVLASGRPRAVLRSSDVAAAVDGYLAGLPATSRVVTVERAVSVDGRSATVSLSSLWRPPVLSLLLPEGLRIQVTVVARSVFF